MRTFSVVRLLVLMGMGLSLGVAGGCEMFESARTEPRQKEKPGPRPKSRATPPRKTEVIKPPDPASVWPPRAIWVVRRGYKTPDQIATLMDRCEQTGFNTVLFQIRGSGTLYCPSTIEPMADEQRQASISFDPLAVACQEAHRRGLALHVWINVMPAWQGSDPPKDSRQLYNTHPEWFLYDQNGKRQPLNPHFYVSLNPCLPEVRQYLANLFKDIVRRYPVDGIHLDYIRFPIEECPKGSDYPYDRRTLSLYAQATKKKPQEDKVAWSQWRLSQVTQLVREIRSGLYSVRPGVRLTAACVPDIEQARKRYFQNGPSWLQSGLVDAVFIMNYTSDRMAFIRRQDEWLQATGSRLAAPGISVNIPGSKTVNSVTEQIQLAQSWGGGFAVFSSNALFTETPRGRHSVVAIRQAIGPLPGRPLRSK